MSEKTNFEQAAEIYKSALAEINKLGLTIVPVLNVVPIEKLQNEQDVKNNEQSESNNSESVQQ